MDEVYKDKSSSLMVERLVKGDTRRCVTAADTPNVVATFACFVCFIVYGACQGSLGAALPSLAIKYNLTHSRSGLTFTCRGLGYLCGTVTAAFILHNKLDRVIGKAFLVCASVVLTGFATGIMASQPSIEIVLFLFFIQGFGFGGIDTIGNVFLPELWGDRVQPWMQALHACFGIGAVIGPAIVGGVGYVDAFIIISILSGVPLLGMLLHHSCRSSSNSTTNESDDNIEGANSEAPWYIRGLVTIFFFIYVGVECGFGGWVPTFVLVTGTITSERDAAFVSSVFWSALTAGRIFAIPLAFYFTTTSSLRFQLLLTLIGAILSCTILAQSYSSAFICSAVIGYGLSSIFPLGMMLLLEYKYPMTAVTTSMFVIGSTFGEGLIPVIIGIAMTVDGPYSLPYITLSSSLFLIALYFTIHMMSSINLKDKYIVNTVSKV